MFRKKKKKVFVFNINVQNSSTFRNRVVRMYVRTSLVRGKRYLGEGEDKVSKLLLYQVVPALLHRSGPTKQAARAEVGRCDRRATMKGNPRHARSMMAMMMMMMMMIVHLGQIRTDHDLSRPSSSSPAVVRGCLGSA